MADGQLNFRLKPEFRLALRGNDMHMHPRLFPGEEVKPVMAVPENRRTHNATIPEKLLSSTAFNPGSDGAWRDCL